MTCSSDGGPAADLPEPGPTAFALPVLVVAGQPADLDIVTDCLRGGGFENLRAVVGGAAGIAALAEPVGGLPAVVVVDMDMRAPDALEVLSDIQAMDPARRPLVLAMARDQSRPTEALGAGAADCMMYPFGGTELLMRVRNLAEVKRREYELLRRSLAHELRAAEYRELADDAAERAAVAVGRFEVLADNCAEVVAHIRGTEVVWISNSAEQAFGWPAEQWIGTDMTHRFHPDDLGTLFAGLAGMDKGVAPLRRMRVRAADGGYRWVEGQAKPCRNGQGDVDGLVISMRLADEQAAAERQRAEAETRYELLFEASPDALMIVGLDGRIRLANVQAERAFGYPREELIGAEVEMLVPARFRGRHAAKRMGFVADPLVRPMGAGLELWGLRRDGSEFPVEISLSPLGRGPGPEVLVAIRDVTDYQETKRRYQMLFEASPDALIIAGSDGRIELANVQAERMFGYPREELIGAEVESLVPARFRGGHAAKRTGFVADPGLRPMGAGLELWGLRRDGSEFPVEISLSPMGRGQSQKVLAAIRDVTDYQETKRRYQMLFEASPDALIIAGSDGRIELANVQAEQTFGCPREELIGAEVENLVPARFRGGHAAKRTGFVADPGLRPMGAGLELWGLRRDGSEFPVEISLSPLGREQSPKVLAAIRDVTDYQETKRRYQMLFEASPDALMIVGLDGRIRLANVQAEKAFGYPREELIGAEVEMLVPARFRGRHAAKRMGFVADPQVRPMGAGLELWGLRRDGSEFPLEISLSPVRIGSNSEVLAAIRDVTERHEAQRLIKVVKHRFESVVRHSPSAISVGDLNHRYTMVNDAFCELFGQPSIEAVIGRTDHEVLPSAAWERQSAAVPRLLGGDHFLEEEAIQRGSRSMWVVTERFGLRDEAGAVNEVVTIRTDITHRREALQEIAERSRWEERVMAPAGQLLVYSQPIVDVATRRTIDEELLVRLRIADSDEILSPGQFLPQCERYQLMPAIDRHMVGRAIDLARAGRGVSVNITSQTISDVGVMDEILDTLTAAGRHVTERMMFEITETTASAAPEIAKNFSLSIRNLGCRVALDDFGTGYGTFTELRHLHLHALKIDRSFVSNMLDDPDDERVVTTIVSVAKAYGLATIAEGVESEAVLDRLAALGVDLAQGYLFGRPKYVLG